VAAFALVGAGLLGPDGLGERDHAPGHALPVEDAWHRRARLDQHQLGRAAADIEDHRRTDAVFEQDVAAEHRQPRFLLRRDHVEPDAGLLPHALDEGRAVARPPARLGRDRTRKPHVASAQLVGADVKRGERPVHRFLAEPSGPGQPLAEPHHAAERVDDHEVLLRRAGDQQAAVVGAEIDRGVGLARARSGWVERAPSQVALGDDGAVAFLPVAGGAGA